MFLGPSKEWNVVSLSAQKYSTCPTDTLFDNTNQNHTSGFDIGLLTFDVAFVPDTNVQPVCAFRNLPNDPTFQAKINCHKATLMGFGYYDAQNGDFS